VGYQPIEDYGVIGDLHTAALVGRDGSIDFLCFPHFDSPSLFAALLDDRKGGRFRISPCLEAATRKQLYLPDTNVLLTRSFSAGGIAEVTDFMTVEEGPGTHAHDLVRQVKTVRGNVRYRMTCSPRFGYGRVPHRVAQDQETSVVFVPDDPKAAATGPVRLRSSVPLTLAGGDAAADFELSAGETAFFTLEDVGAGRASRVTDEEHVGAAFDQTVEFWRRWIRRSRYTGPWREMVHRSALALKLLFSRPHGSLVAAPTFGLPEELGGALNWDYRYTWLRDASYTLYTLLLLGYSDEASRFMSWLEDRCMELDPAEPLQVLYGLDGSREIKERVLDHFEGYRGSRPVRVGNAAYDQLQLDVFGELVDAIYLVDRYGEPIHHDLWTHLVPIVDWVAENWERPDHGFWELREARHENLSGRIMSWVALDRAIRLARRRSFPASVDRWRATRDRIYQNVFSRFWSEEKQAFVQRPDNDRLDAFALVMPLTKFISPTDPRWLSTLHAIERELVDDSLVFRFETESTAGGLPSTEGTFTMCSFWYVECLSRAREVEKARFCFEKALGYANHLGLYSAELGPGGEHLGNFPPAFTHSALISAAYDLGRRLSDPTGRRPRRE